MTDKPALRACLRAARDAFATGHAPPTPTPQLLALFTPSLIVAAYAPVGGEADPAAIAAAASAAGCTIALPHVVSRADPIRFLVGDGGELVVGPFGLRQPAAHCAQLRPDIILTPLVGFDRRGNRLGQGAGHYDRAFAAFPHARRIGVAWSVQEVDALPADPWDVPLHAIITEREWITCR